MELRQYLQVILRAWWLIIPLTLASLTLTLVFSYTRTPIFEATSQHVISFGGPTGTIDRADQYYIIDTLVGRQQIPVTACSAITAGDNVGAALNQLGITNEMIASETFDPAKYDISCNVLPESNVVLIIVQGPSPRVVEQLNRTLGVLGKERVETINNGLITLSVIDRTYLDPEPVAPNHIQNAVLGTALGLVVSLTAALLLDYFRSPLEKMEVASIRDPLTNTYNERYFGNRLAEEVERSKQRNRPISVSLLELKTNEDYDLMPQYMRDEFLYQAALYIQDKLQQGDIVAYRGNLQFSILLPETPGYEARSRLLLVHSALRSHLFRTEQYATSFTSKIGIVESVGEALERINLLEQAEVALKRAENNNTRHIYLMSTQSSAFVLDDKVDADFQLDEILPEDELVDRVSADEKQRREQRGLGRLFGGSGRQKRGQGEQSPFGDAELEPTDTKEFDVEQKLNLQQTPPEDDSLMNKGKPARRQQSARADGDSEPSAEDQVNGTRRGGTNDDREG